LGGSEADEGNQSRSKKARKVSGEKNEATVRPSCNQDLTLAPTMKKQDSMKEKERKKASTQKPDCAHSGKIRGGVFKLGESLL